MAATLHPLVLLGKLRARCAFIAVVLVCCSALQHCAAALRCSIVLPLCAAAAAAGCWLLAAGCTAAAAALLLCGEEQSALPRCWVERLWVNCLCDRRMRR